MNIKQILFGSVLPIAVGVIASPAAGVAVAGLAGSLGLAKKAGQAIEEHGVAVAGATFLEPGYRPHKAGVPALAVILPSILAPYLPPELLELFKNPEFIGAVVVIWHQFTRGLEKSRPNGA